MREEFPQELLKAVSICELTSFILFLFFFLMLLSLFSFQRLMIYVFCYFTGMSYDPNHVRASLERKVRVDHIREEPPLIRRKSANQSKDKNKDKAPNTSTAFPLRHLAISLKASRPPIKVIAQQGASFSNLIYQPNWLVHQEDTCTDLSKAKKLGRGYVTP